MRKKDVAYTSGGANGKLRRLWVDGAVRVGDESPRERV